MAINTYIHVNIHSKGDQSWVFFGRNDAKAETPILWPPDAMNGLIGKNPDQCKHDVLRKPKLLR